MTTQTHLSCQFWVSAFEAENPPRPSDLQVLLGYCDLLFRNDNSNAFELS